LFGLLGLSCKLFLSCEHWADGVKSPWAVVTDEDSHTATVAFGQNLRAATTATFGIEAADVVIAQVSASSFTAGLGWKGCFLVLALRPIAGDLVGLVLRQVEVREGQFGHKI